MTTADGKPVVLSTDLDESNYPIGSKKQAFHDNAMGELMMARSKANYTATATLVSMRKFKDAFTLTDVTVQTWSITGSGTLEGAGAADVEVTAVIEKQAVPTFRYAAFATYPGCKALSFGGGGSTDSYDSSDALDASPASRRRRRAGGTSAPTATSTRRARSPSSTERCPRHGRGLANAPPTT